MRSYRMKTYSAKRRYEVEFHFGEPDPSNRNHKVTSPRKTTAA